MEKKICTLCNKPRMNGHYFDGHFVCGDCTFENETVDQIKNKIYEKTKSN